MNFVTAIKTCLNKYVDFEGRARRAEFWWFALFLVLIGFVGQLLGGDNLEGLVGLALFLPSLAVLVRRLHDRDMTGWWALLILLPLVGWIALLVITVMQGTVGPNRFGPDPINGEAAPQPKPRGAPSEFDSVMDDSYRKSRIPRTGDDN